MLNIREGSGNSRPLGSGSGSSGDNRNEGQMGSGRPDPGISELNRVRDYNEHRFVDPEIPLVVLSPRGAKQY